MWSKKPRPVRDRGSAARSRSTSTRDPRLARVALRPARVRGASASSCAMPGPVPLAAELRGAQLEAADAEVVGERDVGFAVADHRRARPVDAAVAAGSAAPGRCPACASGALSAGSCVSISTSRKTMPWLSNTCSIRSLRAVEVGSREGSRAQAVLVGDHHELVAGVAQLQQRGDHARRRSAACRSGRSGSRPAPRSGCRRGRRTGSASCAAHAPPAAPARRARGRSAPACRC